MSDGFLPDRKDFPLSPEPPQSTEEISSVEADEQALEQLPETQDDFLEQAQSEVTSSDEGGGEGKEGAAASAALPAPAPVKDDIVIRVEKILEQGLGTYYSHMPESAKERFRAKGEEVAFRIADMVRRLRIRIREVLKLIKQWLLTIPGVNKYFLEQEAKIKTDQIIELEQAVREEREAAVLS